MQKIIHENHEISYIDEGKGETIVFFHGTPSSSIEFAETISTLSRNFRCVAVDMLGFGNSAKPAAADYSLIRQAERLDGILQKLTVDSTHLVACDFGGPIAMNVIAKSNIKPLSITFFNTWTWNPVIHPEIARASKLVNTFLGKFLYLYLGFSNKLLIKQAFSMGHLTDEIRRHFAQAHATSESRKSLYKFAQELTGATTAYQIAEETLRKVGAKKQLLWGKNDKLLPQGMIEKWKELELTPKYLDAGHFIGLEKPQDLAMAIDDFISS